MADTKISAMTAATTPLAGTEEVPIVQSSANRKVAVSDLTAGRSVSALNYIPSGSTVPTNGMYLSAANTLNFATNSTLRLDIGSTGNIGIGASAGSATNILNSKNITGATTAYGVRTNGIIQSDVTSTVAVNSTGVGTAAAAFTLSTLIHYNAGQSGFGATSAVTNQYGFIAESSLTGATNNYGFGGFIPSGSNRYNLYMAGTADNYLAGRLSIGAAPASTVNLFLQSNITGSTTAFGMAQNATIQSGVTGGAVGYQSALSTAAASFTVSKVSDFLITAGSLGASSAITTQNGFTVDNTVRNATTTNGFLAENTQLITAGLTFNAVRIQTNIATGGGTTRAIYADGTAPSMHVGLFRFGATTVPVNTVDITGSLGRGAPVTKTGDFTLAATENWVIVNQAGTTTVTLPAASSWTSREVMFKTITANTLVSASSNVVPLAGGAASTAILAAAAGTWATLVSDGTNWVIMQG